MAKPIVQWLAVAALVGANLPMIAAGFLALFNCTGDHELRCSFGDRRMEITLHHGTEPSTGAMVGHSHTWLETALIGESVSGDEPDHHFGFARQSVLTADDDLRHHESVEVAEFKPAAFEILMDCPSLIESSLIGRPLENLSGLSPPLMMRRGVMMRI